MTDEDYIQKLERDKEDAFRMIWLLVHAAHGEVLLGPALLQSYDRHDAMLQQEDDPATGGVRIKAFSMKAQQD